MEVETTLVGAFELPTDIVHQGRVNNVPRGPGIRRNETPLVSIQLTRKKSSFGVLIHLLFPQKLHHRVIISIANVVALQIRQSPQITHVIVVSDIVIH